MPAITNDLFVWGKVSSSSSDLAVVEADPSYRTVKGAEGGELIYADLLNSALRCGSLFAYSFVEALRIGPANASDWATSGSPIDFDYKVADTSIASLASSLSDAFHAYLERSDVAYAAQAGEWRQPISIQISSSDGTGLGEAAEVDGSQDQTIKLPSSIKADLQGLASSAATVIVGQESQSGVKSLILGNVGTGDAQALEAGESLTYDVASKTLSSPKASIPTLLGSYGVCSTAALTKAKTVSIPGFSLQDGARVCVRFEHANTNASPTLNVSSTGAKPIILPISSEFPTAMNFPAWLSGEVLELAYVASEGASGSWVICGTGAYAKNAMVAQTASVAGKLTSTTVGSLTKPIYLSSGIAIPGYETKRLWSSSLNAARYVGDGDATAATYTGQFPFSVCLTASQASNINWIVRADVKLSTEMQPGTWFRFDLVDLCVLAGLSGVTFMYADQIMAVANGISLKTNSSSREMMVCSKVESGARQAYAYVGYDSASLRYDGFCASLTFLVTAS